MDLVKPSRRFIFRLPICPLQSRNFSPQATENTMFDQPNSLFGIEKFSRSHDFPLIQESSQKSRELNWISGQVFVESNLSRKNRMLL